MQIPLPLTASRLETGNVRAVKAAVMESLEPERNGVVFKIFKTFVSSGAEGGNHDTRGFSETRGVTDDLAGDSAEGAGRKQDARGFNVTKEIRGSIVTDVAGGTDTIGSAISSIPTVGGDRTKIDRNRSSCKAVANCLSKSSG